MVRTVYCLALAGYLGVYLYLTFFSRVPDGQHRMRLMPFYSLTHLYGPEGLRVQVFREMILNLALYLPFGALLPGCMREGDHAYRISFCLGMGMILLTEILQYILCLGLAETDDVIHNALGLLAGIAGFHAVRRAVRAMDGRG